jgi:hypothetical protein
VARSICQRRAISVSGRQAGAFYDNVATLPLNDTSDVHPAVFTAQRPGSALRHRGFPQRRRGGTRDEQLRRARVRAVAATDRLCEPRS